MEKDLQNIEQLKEFYSKVIIISCGGTINMKGNSNCLPSDGINQIVKKIQKDVSKLGVTYEIIEIFDRAPDSSNMGQDEWDILMETIKSILMKKDKARADLLKNGIKIEKGGIVITHGTDTLDLTSLVISLEFSSIFKKDNPCSLPIVFTASHSTIDDVNSDAHSNLLKSLFVAREKFDRDYNLPSGVYVLIGQDIHLASRITKVYTRPNFEGKYFFSFPSPIGMISGREKRGKEKRFKINSDFLNDLTTLDNISLEKKENRSWGLVEHINLDWYSSPKIISQLEKRISFYKSKYEKDYGVVVQGDFEKNENFVEIIQRLKTIATNGTFVFFGSKTVYERIVADNSDVSKIGLIPKCLSHLKAKIKLSWLLRFNLTDSQILKYMNSNIAGELVPNSILPEWINYETLHPNMNNHEIILAYPNIEPKVFVDAIKRIDLDASERKLYIYGFGDGHIPTTNESILAITNKFLKEVVKIEDKYMLKNEDIYCLITELTDIVKENSIKSFFNYYHHINKDKLAKLILKKRIEQVIEKKKKKIANTLVKTFGKDAEIKNIDTLIKEFTDKIKFNLDYNSVKSERDSIFLNENLDNENAALEYMVKNMPEKIAERLIKEAIMYSDEKMRVIGQAIDNGIQVIIKSYAVRSQTNTQRYEMGNKLWFLGVDSEINPGLETTIICSDNSAPETLSNSLVVAAK